MIPSNVSDDPYRTEPSEVVKKLSELSDKAFEALPRDPLPEIREQLEMEVPDITIPTFNSKDAAPYEPPAVEIPAVVKLPPPTSMLPSSDGNSNMGFSNYIHQSVASTPLPTDWLTLRG